jgi:DNA mismatch repair protein MutL
VQPAYFIYLEIDPEQIDVNVHPQKTEVKFSNQSAVWQIINAAVRETLAKSGAVPMMDFDSEERVDIPVLGRYMPPVKEPAMVRSAGYNPFTKYGGGDSGSGFGAGAGFGADSGAGFGAGASEFEYISSAADGVQTSAFEAGPGEFTGVTNIGEGYATAVWRGRFVAVDLRRAREAVLFERFERSLRLGRSATQQLLFPERMALSADDAELMRDHAAEFAAFGFDVRPAGEHAVEIFGTPADIAPERLDEVIYDMLDALRDGIFAGDDARRERLAAVMARSGAGTSASMAKLSAAETESLLGSLADIGCPGYTPSGKVVIAEMIDEIRNKLK